MYDFVKSMISLDTPIEKLPRVSPRYIARLQHLGITTVRRLLWHFPARYQDFSQLVDIASITTGGEVVSIQGVVSAIETKRAWKRNMTITTATIDDGTDTIQAVWFNQPYLQDSLAEGTHVSLAGKVSEGKHGLYLSNPAFEKITNNEDRITKHTQGLVPIYPETEGLSSKYLRFLIKPLLDQFRIPYLREIHFPTSMEEAEVARKHFAFEELLLFQLRSLIDRSQMQKADAPAIPFEQDAVRSFVHSLPFQLTDDQRKAAYEILKDLQEPHPMNRLLNGDVGSGKTVVALIAAYQTARAGYKAVFMAPTELLAFQHYQTATALGLRVGLMTSSKKTDTNAEIVIGTHAVIQDKVKFEKLGLVVIDEQHRFGIAQRRALLRGQAQIQDTQNDADFLYENITYKIRGAIFTVKKTLGLGHKELVYHNALKSEFKKLGLQFESEKSIDVYYEGEKVGAYQPDLIVEDKVIVELKAVPFKAWKGKEQTWKYLRATQYKLALLVNFSTSTVQIERIIFDTARVSASQREKSAMSLRIPKSQRQSAFIPHLLSMTATPIPRTLTLTLYGDLDVSLIKQKPAGRIEIITKVIPHNEREVAYRFIDSQMKAGRQVFVICPRIQKSDVGDQTSDIKTVTAEYEKLKTKIFPHRRVAMLHGKLKAKDKEQIMADFKDKKYDLIVSTSVIEVGVDVPNATIMMIESAERFGLAQLHQFRGRVGRGAHQSYCYLFTTPTLQSGPRPESVGGTTRRLKAMESTSDGFRLAEMDLKIRGPGEFAGTHQSGIPDLAMASLSDITMIQEARVEAKKVISEDPTLANHPDLKARLEELQKIVHFE